MLYAAPSNRRTSKLWCRSLFIERSLLKIDGQQPDNVFLICLQLVESAKNLAQIAANVSETLGASIEDLMKNHRYIQAVVSQFYANEELESVYRVYRFAFYIAWEMLVAAAVYFKIFSPLQLAFPIFSLSAEVLAMWIAGPLGLTKLGLMETVVWVRRVFIYFWGTQRLNAVLFRFLGLAAEKVKGKFTEVPATQTGMQIKMRSNRRK